MRIVSMVVLAVSVSLALLLLITYRNLGDMSRAEVQGRYVLLVAQQESVVDAGKSLFGDKPPLWAMRMMVVWHKADPLRWWWLPFLFVAVQALAVRFTRKRMRR